MLDSPVGCQVWWAAVTDVLPWHLELLDPVERSRRDRYVRSADRDRFTLGVALTRLRLADLLGMPPRAVRLDRRCDQCGAPHGPPRLVADGGAVPHLSISHSGERVVLAVSDGGPVGIDVEADTGRIDEAIAGHLLSATERARWPGAAPPEPSALLTYWTRKEAVVKATGEGLRVPLSHLTVSAHAEPPRLLAWEGRSGFDKRVAMHTLSPGTGYSACLALLDQPVCPVTEFSATELLTEPGQGHAQMRVHSVEP